MNTEQEQITPVDARLEEAKAEMEKLIQDRISALMQECMDISFKMVAETETSTVIVKKISVEVNMANDEVNLTTDIGIFTNNQKS